MDQIFLALESRIPELYPDGVWNPGLSKILHEGALPSLLKAALLLWNDELNDAHCIVQTDPSDSAKLIHGIMHRREGDFFNAKDWHRQIHSHPAWNKIKRVYPDWEPLSFVDKCQQAKEGRCQDPEILKAVQSLELKSVAQCMADSL